MNSTLRKGLRLLNLFISKNRRFSDFPFKNIKEYKVELLTKIMFFSGQTFYQANYEKVILCLKVRIFVLQKMYNQANKKFCNKSINCQKVFLYHIKGIKRQLLFLEDIYLKENICFSHSKIYFPLECFQNVIQEIHQLNALCKKRKQKN